MESKLLKKNIIAIGLFFLPFSLLAQLYVSANNFVFAKGEYVFVTKNLELKENNSNFYLRDNAQLLQGSSTEDKNKGMGTLSLFQQGSTNNFHYNYWCSPVGLSNISEGNSAFGITQLKDITSLITSIDATQISMNNYDGTASPTLSIAPLWINKLSKKSGYSDWINVGYTATLLAGEGFTMKGTSGTNNFTVNGIKNNAGSQQRYDFRGRPNNGDISIPIADQEFTLTGNPYPSAIDLSLFLQGNSNCTGIAYFWEQDKSTSTHFIADYKGGYGSFSPVSRLGTGVYIPATFYTYDGSGNSVAETGSPTGNSGKRFLDIGQGFLIDGVGTGSVLMKNEYRVYVKQAPIPATGSRVKGYDKLKIKSGNMQQIPSVSGFDYTKVSLLPTPQIRINTLMNNQGVRQLALAFDPAATDGIDHAMDAYSSGDSDQADAYFVIENSDFVINVLNFDINKKIAIGFRNNEEASYKLTVQEVINFTDTDEVYLHDKVNNKFFDIKNDFHELILPAGENNSQFEITFKSDSSLGIVDNKNERFIIYQDNSAKKLTIENPQAIELEICGLYDVAGKLIFLKKDLGSASSQQFSTAGLGDGIFIVKMITKDKEVVGKKIIIKN